MRGKARPGGTPTSVVEVYRRPIAYDATWFRPARVNLKIKLA